ncbi:MAG: response regulator transcription factor [Chitinophagales bacterium]|nr:response regulator transcription factor [Chitinophagales bacterium]
MSIRVTLFDDNKSLCDSLFQLINGSPGFRCAGAFPNCNELLNDIRKSKPDVVLMDIEMPGMSGIEAVKLIKENFPEIKILMETIFEDDEKIFASVCSGAEGYILKNTPPAEILDAIQEVYAGGAPMTPSIATKVLKMFKSQNVLKKSVPSDLSHREKEILTCLVEGMSYKMIGDHCSISIDTVGGHIRNIYKKLQVHSKSEAVVKAIRGKIV